MKKTIFLILCLLLVLPFVVSMHGFPGPICSRSYAERTDFPAPFAKLKQIALAMAPDSNGDYVWQKGILTPSAQTGDPEESIEYMIVYFPAKDVVGIAKTKGPETRFVGWFGRMKSYIVEAYSFGRITYQEFISKENAIEGAYKFFQELVANKLI